MASQSIYKGISKRAQSLLEAGESKNVDYKEKVKGLHAEDLVAFANSSGGGTILVGIREAVGTNSAQVGEPIGHPIDDDSKLQIMSKALSCSPPIQIALYIENSDFLPFYRIEIPTGPQKPYATSSGTYKIREDGRNNPLLPEQLLKMFLERESEEFRSRFSQATKRLEARMTKTLRLVGNLEDVVSGKIEEIGSSLGWAEYKASDSTDTIDSVAAMVGGLVKDGKKQARRLKSLIGKLQADDPVKKDAEQEIIDSLVRQFGKEPSTLSALRAESDQVRA